MDDPEAIMPDSEQFKNEFDSYTDDKVTILTYYFHNRETGTIWCMEACECGVIRDVENVLAFPVVFNQVRFLQYGQVAGNGGGGDVKMVADLTGGFGAAFQQIQDFPPGRIRQGFQCLL